ncbi:MAG: tetratricopeptide repeat protein [Pseudomonadota bacterium]
MRDTVVIEEIGLPPPLVEMGYSGTVAAHRLWDSTQWINDHAGTTKDRASLIAASRQLKITEPGTGLSASGVVQMVRQLIGREQPRIAAEFICRDVECSLEKMELRLRVFSGDGMEVTNAGRLGDLESEEVINAYFDQAALALLKIIDPYVRASFLYAVEQGALTPTARARATVLVKTLDPLSADSDQPRSTIEALALLRARHPQGAWAGLLLAVQEYRNGNMEATLIRAGESVTHMQADRIVHFPNALSARGSAFLNLGNVAEAIQEYKAALAIDPEYISAMVGLGNAFSQSGRTQEVIEKYEMVFTLDPANIYANNGWGTTLRKHGDNKSAIEKFNASLEVDPTFDAAFDNWIVSLTVILDSADPEMCAQFSELFPNIERYANTPQRAIVLADRFEDTTTLCSRPSGKDLSDLEEIRFGGFGEDPIAFSTTIPPKGNWIILDSNLPPDSTIAVSLKSIDEVLSVHVLDRNHRLVGERDAQMIDKPALGQRVVFKAGSGPYLLRMRHLRPTESSATVVVSRADEWAIRAD